MSLDATRWAWQQHGIRAADKFVLLSLADRADEEHFCFPSIARLSADTLLDRKTVLASIARLEAAGLLTADRRHGAGTRYQLVGVSSRHESSAENGTGLERALPDQPLCAYCGERTSCGLDHILPKSRGGGDGSENLVAACRKCNSAKGTMLPSEWVVSGGYVPEMLRKTSTEIGTGCLDDFFRTSPKNGTRPVPKTGPLPVPKTGHESTNEPIKNRKSKSACADEPETVYGFAGETVRVTSEDFDRLAGQYPNLDLMNELRQLDLELRGQRKWWHALNSKLNYRNKAHGNGNRLGSNPGPDRSAAGRVRANAKRELAALVATRTGGDDVAVDVIDVRPSMDIRLRR